MGTINVVVPSYEEVSVVIPSYEEEKISIIIPSCKEDIVTLHSLGSCPVEFEVVISRDAGLGRCRNNGARKAQNDLIVMLDDDIVLSPEIWGHVLNVKHGEFAMAFLSGFPCSRVVAVHADDFWSVGGFDESIRFTGEDRDFYVRALLAGLKFKEIPLSLIQHKEHLVRYRNIHTGIACVKENVKFIMRHGGYLPQVFSIDFLGRLRKGQLRTLLLQTVLLIYFILKGDAK